MEEETRNQTEGFDRARHIRKLLFLIVTGAIVIIMMVLFVYQFIEFSDSTAFCGETCHEVMYPEFTAYQASPHSRVTCAECHVGSGADYLVRSKLSGIPLIVSTITGNYQRPIPTPVENLRPARETCEQCHRPDRFAGDLVRQHTSYKTDEANTASVDIRVLRVGGGQGQVARDIHWHVAADVWYLPLDAKRQEIAWVSVGNDDGSTDEYLDSARTSEFTSDDIEAGKKLMDCMDCHNRATHIFQSPEDLIDQALLQGKIDTGLPYIKKEGMAALVPTSASLAEAETKVEGIREYYRANYPVIMNTMTAEIDAAISELKEIARLTTFPEMNVDWNTYINNNGHIESPGCLRCHGKLVASGGPAAGQPIDDTCESCHYFELP